MENRNGSNQSRQNNILKDIDGIIRKPIDEQGCKKLVTFAKETDLSYVSLLISTGEKYFEPAFYLWHKYESRLSPHIALFMNIVHSKIIHSKMDQLRLSFDRFKDKYQRSTRKRVILLEQSQIKMYQTDTKLKSYAIECEKAKNQPERDKKTMFIQHQQKETTFVAILNPNKELGVNYLESRLCVLKDMYYKIKLANERPEKREEEMKLVEKLEERPAISRDCINCISFVYEDEDLNFPLSRQPVTYFGKILTISTMQREILQQIVSYLNGKGGVLLIGTQKVNQKIVPIVQEVAEFHKEQQEDRIQTALGLITPAITLNKQVELAFIPIADNVRKHPQDTRPVWKGNGACILRITVTPTEPHKTYYYAVPSNPQTPQNAQLQTAVASQAAQTTPAFNIFSRNTELGDEQLKNEEIYDFMKERYREYDPASRAADFVLRDRGNYHPCLIRHIDRCKPPEKGEPFYGDKSYYQDNSKKKENQTKSANPLLTGLESYKNISLLVVVSTLVDRIYDIFKNEEKLESKINIAFEHKKFKLSNNTFLVFHNCKFQKLKNGITKSKAQLKAQNDKKDVLLISTLPTLAFDKSKLTKDLQEELEKEVEIQAKEKLQFKLIENIIYIKCLSTITAVYIYFYLHHNHSLKGTFEKIPQGSAAKSKILKNASKYSKPSTGAGKNDKKYETKGSKQAYGGYNEEHEEEDQYYEDEDDYYEKPSSPKKQNHKNYDHNNNKYQQKPINNSHQYNDNNGNYYDYTTEQNNNNNNNYQSENEPVPTNNQYPSYQPPVVEQKVPIYLESRYDEFGNRYDYYDNSIVYIYYPTGQLYTYQYYPMTQ